MKSWSEKLINLSKTYFETGFCNVKSLSGNFGYLILDDESNQYKITLFNSNQEFIFNSVDEILKAGWAVD
jgi:hypothetical protein